MIALLKAIFGGVTGFLNTYIAYIRWAIILGGLAASFWAGLHWANLTCSANKHSEDATVIKDHKETGEKVHAVHQKVDALPDGGAAIELRKRWNRDHPRLL
jgi:hypothetical protein